MKDKYCNLFITQATTEGEKEFDRIELDNKDVEAWKLIFNKAGWYEAYHIVIMSKAWVRDFGGKVEP